MRLRPCSSLLCHWYGAGQSTWMHAVTESGIVLPGALSAPPPLGSPAPVSSLSRTPLGTRLQLPPPSV
jgi:hypothetical protein